MASPDELRAQLEESRSFFRAALGEIDPAAWEKQPASGEGEDAWSPRQAAQHAIGAEAFFTTAICTACGYPGVEAPKPDFATPADAVKGFDEVVELTNKKLKYITVEDLAKPHDRFGSVEGLLKTDIGHLRDHAEQMKTAANS
jgi:hypothetical protein